METNGESNPLQLLLQGNGMPYYSGWVHEGMRRVGLMDRLVTPNNRNLSEVVAKYLSVVTETFATADEEAHHRRNEAIGRFVHRTGGPMGTSVANIHRGDCAVFYGGFYLLNPSTSNLCDLARESYAAASAALAEVTLFPGVFFKVIETNIEGIVESLASVSKDVIKPNIRIEPFLAVLGSTKIKPNNGNDKYAPGSVLLN